MAFSLTPWPIRVLICSRVALSHLTGTNMGWQQWRSSLKGHKSPELTSATPAVCCPEMFSWWQTNTICHVLMPTVKIKRFIDFLLTTSGVLIYCWALWTSMCFFLLLFPHPTPVQKWLYESQNNILNVVARFCTDCIRLSSLFKSVTNLPLKLSDLVM